MHDEVISEYSNYVQSFLNFKDSRIKKLVNSSLIEKKALWPDALIQVNPNYEPAGSLDICATEEKLHPDIPIIFRDRDKKSIILYQHQREAIKKANENRSYVVTTGTGSGKSLTYLIPIFNSILKEDQTPKVRAIIVYPMNALVNSQFSTLNQLKEAYETDTGKEFPIKFEKYTGQEKEQFKNNLQKNPPHILLTNYVMLELMLVRPDEKVFVDASTSHIEYLVFDELHTYRGRQGADVALLVRRLSSRSGKKDLKCIGTSATMVSGKNTTSLERREAVSQFASSMFGLPIAPDDVIEETLKRLTISDGIPSGGNLVTALGEPLPSDIESIIKNPLVSWVELTFGIGQDKDERYIRNVPISLKEGAEQLAMATGQPIESCESKLHEIFLAGSKLRNERGKPLIAFKIHQFFSQGGSLYGSVETADSRELSLERKYYAGERGSKVLFPIRFCRVCGQEYYTVRKDEKGKKFVPFDDFTNPGDDQTDSVGYLILAGEGSGSAWDLDMFPIEWTDKNGKVEKNYRSHVPIPFLVRPDGSYSEGAKGESEDGSVRVWYEPRPFLLCMNCGEYYQRNRGSEFRKLASLATEGRSTTTTVLTLSCFKNAPIAEIIGQARKILSFTDNRQDASLQAGHFNDFTQISYLRGAVYRALEKNPSRRFDEIADSVIAEMGLSLSEFAKNKQMQDFSPQADAVRKVFSEFIAYRVYEDLQRGWRVVQPNLEQCGLVLFQYLGLYDLVHNPDLWRFCPEKFARADPDQFFFKHREQLVAGVVRPPTIDLGNEDLVKAHVHAIWLGSIGLPLGRSIIDVIDPESGAEELALNVNVRNQIDLSTSAIHTLVQEVKDILETCEPDLTQSEWYSEGWALRVLTETVREFDEAFNRWRGLYRAAQGQMNIANAHLQSLSVAKGDQVSWKQLHGEAVRQIEILKNQSSNSNESDFYPYRYLASEGFLPGYNFPRLPIRAFVTSGRGEGEYITRPRFLALTEFGPHTFLYHEGTKYQVQRLQVPPGGLSRRRSKAKICKVCGYYHDDKQADVCEYCHSQLDGSQSEVIDLLEMTDVVAKRWERITSDEEERDRRGYEVSTHFRLAQKDGVTGKNRVLTAIAYDGAGKEMFKLTYGQAATLLRVNHGWRAGQSKSFYVDMERGTIETASSFEQAQNGSTPGGTINANHIEPVRLMTHDTVNLMLIEYIGEPSAWTLNVQATVLYAIKHGCEGVFQVDDNEVATERIGSPERSILLFWEDSEGGLGILKRLVQDPRAFARVCTEALRRCHFDPETLEDLEKDACPAACYECLLSYRNQPDYPLINRYDAKDLLSQASKGFTGRLFEDRNREEHYQMLLSICDPDSVLERRFIEQLYQTNRRLPDTGQILLSDAYAQPDFYVYPNVCIFCDGSIHARPDIAEHDREQRSALKNLGYRIVAIVDLLSGDPHDRRSNDEKMATVLREIQKEEYADLFTLEGKSS